MVVVNIVVMILNIIDIVHVMKDIILIPQIWPLVLVSKVNLVIKYNIFNTHAHTDTNECDTHFGICSQYCKNTIGSYFCPCAPGYVTSSEHDCKATGQDLNHSSSPWQSFLNYYRSSILYSIHKLVWYTKSEQHTRLSDFVHITSPVTKCCGNWLSL